MTFDWSTITKMCVRYNTELLRRDNPDSAESSSLSTDDANALIDHKFGHLSDKQWEKLLVRYPPFRRFSLDAEHSFVRLQVYAKGFQY